MLLIQLCVHTYLKKKGGGGVGTAKEGALFFTCVYFLPVVLFKAACIASDKAHVLINAGVINTA